MDDKIRGLKQTHQPSPWINDYGQFSIMLETGAPVSNEDNRALSLFNRDVYRRGRQRSETYQLPQTLIADFKSKLSTVGGQAFPAAVELEDSLGQKFDITSLRGKYVYIDLWASWCVPCIKEIPSLLKLGEETASQTE